VNDVESWIYNLTEANAAGYGTSPRWYQLYKFKEAFEVADLSPASLDQLTMKFARNKTELTKVFYDSLWKAFSSF
jgi:hypothetical protein